MMGSRSPEMGSSSLERGSRSTWTWLSLTGKGQRSIKDGVLLNMKGTQLNTIGLRHSLTSIVRSSRGTGHSLT